ncbi:MAG TPA: MBL fold metallo-hydrolase [Kiritimatiellia bacterium]|nr:MBL fold metallo-hydrolase [Kiritimatiellia bacterium]
MIDVETLVVSLFESNCFIVYNGDLPDVLVIDPGDNASDIISHLKSKQLVPAAYLITHGHVDHVTGLAEMVASMPAPVAMHPKDAAWAFTDRAAFPPYYDKPTAPPKIERTLAENQEWTDIGLAYRVIETPGHSPGGVAFYFPDEKVLFSGDNLFRGSIGRSDLPGANPELLAESLQKLLKLPDDTRVFCGHGPDTTIGQEKRTNPYLKSFDWAGR